MEGLEVRSASFIAQLEPSEVADATGRALDNVARLTQSAAVDMRFSQRSQDRFDPQPLDQRRQIRRAVGGVALQRFGFGARASSRSRNGWHVDEQWQRDLI